MRGEGPGEPEGEGRKAVVGKEKRRGAGERRANFGTEQLVTDLKNDKPPPRRALGALGRADPPRAY